MRNQTKPLSHHIDHTDNTLLVKLRFFFLAFDKKAQSLQAIRPLAPEAIAKYERCFDEETIRATNEEFRAAASVDLEHDEADKGQKITCPMLILWSKNSWKKFDVLKVWKQFDENVEGYQLDGGHFLPEEAPKETTDKLMNFLM